MRRRDRPLLVSAGADRRIHLWDLKDGRKRQEFDAQVDVRRLTFSPDCTVFASAGGGREVVLRETESGKECGRIVPSIGGIEQLVFSPDGNALAMVDGKSRLELRDVKTLKELPAPPGLREGVTALAFAADGKLLATGHPDHSIRLWDTRSFQEMLSIPAGAQATVTQLQFSPDGGTLVSTATDKEIRLWETRTGKSRGHLDGHVGAVLSIAFTPDGRARWLQGALTALPRSGT